MDREEGLRFLRAHQPLPPDASLDEETIRRFDTVRAFFAANPEGTRSPRQAPQGSQAMSRLA